jgi:hypothetical protein
MQPTAAPTASTDYSQQWKTNASELMSMRPQNLKPLEPLSDRRLVKTAAAFSYSHLPKRRHSSYANA